MGSPRKETFASLLVSQFSLSGGTLVSKVEVGGGGCWKEASYCSIMHLLSPTSPPFELVVASQELFHWIMHPVSGISWAPLHLKSSPHVSLGSNEASFPASHWPTIFHPAEPPPGCTHSSPCPGLFSCVLLCSAGYLSQEAVIAQLEFTWSFLLPCSLSKRVHLAFQPWRFSDTTLLLPKMENFRGFAEKLHILLQPKTNSSLLNIYHMLSAVMLSRNLWCSWWNETDTCETIWEQQSTIKLSALLFWCWNMCYNSSPTNTSSRCWHTPSTYAHLV